MALEQYQPILYPLISMLAAITAILSIKFVIKLRQKESRTEIKKTMTLVFTFLSTGFILYAAAEILWSVLSWMGKSPEQGIPDLLWTIGYILMFIGFAYFAVYMYTKKGKLLSGLGTMGLTGIILGITVYYMITSYLYVSGAGTFTETALNYFYPIAGSAVVIASIAVYLFFRDFEQIGTALLGLALANFLGFAGDVLYAYYSWRNIYGLPGITSDILYVLEYLVSATAFYILLKSSNGNNSNHNNHNNKRNHNDH